MANLRSRWGDVWMDTTATPIDALSVTETSGGTVQVCIGVRDLVRGDRCGSTQLDELLLELDPMAAGELAEKMVKAALEIEKRKAVAAVNHN